MGSICGMIRFPSMPRQQKDKPSARTKFTDSVYLLVAALAVVAVVLGFVGLLIAYNDAPWMPHGERATLLRLAIFGFAFGAANLYLTWQSVSVQRALAGKPYLRSLSALTTPWWTSFTLSLIGFAAAIYCVSVFVGGRGAAGVVNVSAPVQLFVGAILVVSGVIAVVITLKGRRYSSINRALVVFGLLVPAVLIAVGIAQVFSACWYLLR